MFLRIHYSTTEQEREREGELEGGRREGELEFEGGRREEVCFFIVVGSLSSISRPRAFCPNDNQGQEVEVDPLRRGKNCARQDSLSTRAWAFSLGIAVRSNAA